MAYVQVNNASQTLRIATFIVAFFSSFFSYSGTSYPVAESRPAENISALLVKCTIGSLVLATATVSADATPQEINTPCLTSINVFWIDTTNQQQSLTADQCYVSASVKSVDWNGLYYQITYSYGFKDYPEVCLIGTRGGRTSASTTATTEMSCDSQGDFSFLGGENDDTCYRHSDIQELLDAEMEQEKKEEYCKGLVLDSGNNTANNMCYTSPFGSNSCNIQKIVMGSGEYSTTYYEGTSSSDGGCYTSDNPEYDDTGAGDQQDGCIYSGGVNYCEANRDKHCPVIGGTEVCDDGCIDDGIKVFCDVNRHPDVGEGESDYFNDNGTCSVIAASSNKGFCEEMGGTWDETQDYQETACPIGTGACSVASAGYCRACLDAGGAWTPDDLPPTPEQRSELETQALIKSGNDKLTSIENGQKAIGESTISTLKSGSGKVVAAIEALGEKLDKPQEQEKESFTTTTTAPDKSKINALFDDASKAALQVDVENLQSEITALMTSISAEAKTMFTITVPASTGYLARNLTLTQGSFDLSLNRFSDFFKALAMPIMLICSILAGFILLGGKK